MYNGGVDMRRISGHCGSTANIDLYKVTKSRSRGVAPAIKGRARKWQDFVPNIPKLSRGPNNCQDLRKVAIDAADTSNAIGGGQ